MSSKSKKPNPAIVIPIYKSSFSHFELISISRIFLILGSHPIVLLVPFGQAANIIKAIDMLLPDAKYRLHVVQDNWLDSVASYNHLLLTPNFYAYYGEFTHILIAQLDSYVFRDELIEWCLQPWAYIGAPIYPKGSQYGEKNCQAIGCGGFSLRNLKSFEEAFYANPNIVSASAIWEVLSNYNWKGMIVKALHTLFMLVSGDTMLIQRKNAVHMYLGINEDVVYGKLLPSVMPSFRVPPYAEACKFSLDTFIEIDLPLVGNLPFGTHAWYTNDANIMAWAKWIPELTSLHLKR